MNINKELLERYHSNTCTLEECIQVEEWLFNAEVEDLDSNISSKEKIDIKADIWNNIESALPQKNKSRSHLYFMWKGAIAASFLIFALAAAFYFIFRAKTDNPTLLLSLENLSNNHLSKVNKSDYNALIAPNTIVKFNEINRITDLKGSFLISPKKDIEINVGLKTYITLKKNQTYIVLRNGNGLSDILVVSERNLLDLPPVLQQQISNQFGI